MIINQIKKINKEAFLEFKNKYIDYLSSEDYHVHYLDGKLIKVRKDYLLYFKDVYNFPNYYNSKSIDAFIDCMQDLDFWDDKQGFVIVIYNYSEFLDGMENEKELFNSALKSIAYYLEKECLTTSGGRNRLKSFDVYLIDEEIDM